MCKYSEEVLYYDGVDVGQQLVADKLAEACANAVKENDVEKAEMYAKARQCVLELFPDLD